jgi:hypothetical protein
MSTHHNTFHGVAVFIGAVIAALSFIVFASFVAQGQTTASTSVSGEESGSVHGIVFPVEELGGCANKNECKSYCNEAVNMEACIAFAKGHGLMTEKDAERAEKFTKHVQAGSGPGGCNSPEICQEYCSSVAHLDECTSFAEKNGFKNEHYEQGKKIQSFLKNGGQTPGNCQTKEDCQKYCSDFTHARECSDFAQKTGIMKKGNDSSHEPSADQLGKIAELAEKGETPGKCSSKDECEKYCSDKNHRDECLDFGVKVGFIKSDEASKIKELGGKGPGDCDSQELCRAYCNDQSHHEECFAFAESHGFMTHDESEKVKEGWTRAHMGFENAPEAVQECLKTTVGESMLGDIESGKLVPGADISGQVRACFEKFGKDARPQDALKNTPPEVTVCLKEKLGADFDKIRAGKASTTPEMGDVFRGCFQGFQMKMDMRRGTSTGERREPFFEQKKPDNREEGEQRPMGQTIESMLRSAPPGVAACIKEKFPEGFPQNKEGVAEVNMEVKTKIRECFENFRPSTSTPPLNRLEKPQGTQTGEFHTEGGMMAPRPETNLRVAPSGGLVNMPPEVISCIREAIGEENFQKMQNAPASLEMISVVRTCLEKNAHPEGVSPEHTGAPVTFLEKFIGAAFLPLRWVLGK